jgi:hypothetical protein
MRSPLILAAGLLLAAAAVSPTFSADAPAGTPVRVRGTIDKLDGSTLSVVARDDTKLMIGLAPGFMVGTVKNVDLAAIKPGDFVGSAAVKGKDGRLRALEVHVFPEAMRGTGEGQRPWDAGPDSSMTNATVGEVSSMSAGGRSLTLTYKGGQAVIDVPPDTPVVTFAPGDASMLLPGKAVIVFAIQNADGTLTSNRVTVEYNGVKPPL